jgi:hypothetical protein
MKDRGSFFSIKLENSTLRVSSNRNFYRGASNSDNGGVFRITSVNSTVFFNEENSNYTHNLANSGGVFYCFNCSNVAFKNV